MPVQKQGSNLFPNKDKSNKDKCNLVIVPNFNDYRIVGRMGEGTFSEVLKCQNHIDGKLYACKRMKQKYESVEQINNLREIQALRRLNPHPNIIQLKEVIFDRQSKTLSLICELMDMNIYEFIKDRKSFIPEEKVQMYMYQLCKSIYHMHKNGIFHRDVKPENILIKDNTLKLADFGSCKSVYSKEPYTEYISTRWYRAPECLLTDGFYGHKMDMWSVGCVIFEVMTLRPLFPGSNEVDQVSRIHDVIGTPSSTILQKFKKHQSRHMDLNFPLKQGSGISAMLKHGSKGCVDLITQLCTYDPDSRLTAKQALRHPYFRNLREAERRAKQDVRSPLIAESVSSRLLVSNPQSSRIQRSNPHHHKKLRHRSRLNQLGVGEYYSSGIGSSAAVSGVGSRHLPGGGVEGQFLPSISKQSFHQQQQQHPHPNHQRHGMPPSGTTSGYTSMSMSTKSIAHDTFLPSIYGDKVSSQHALYPSVGPKRSHHHQPHHHHHHHITPAHKQQPPHLPAITKHRTGAG